MRLPFAVLLLSAVISSASMITAKQQGAVDGATGLPLKVELPVAFLILTLLVACVGPLVLKQQVKTIIAMKAPATVIALFWKDAIIHTLMLFFLGSGDGPIYEDTVDPDVTTASWRGYVLRLSHVGSFVVLCLTMIPCIRSVEAFFKDNEKSEHRAILLASFSMTPVWAFKGIAQNFMADLDEHVAAPPKWLYNLLFAIGIALVASVFTMPASELRTGQHYCVSVLALAAASTHAGVAFAFSDVAKIAAGDHWNEEKFQSAYTPIVTIFCLALSAVFHKFGKAGNSPFARRLMCLLKLVPGFVAAWAWQALGHAIAKKHWPVPSHEWAKVERQLALGGAWGMVAFVIAGLQVFLSVLPCVDEEAVHEVLTTVAGCNVGWAWKGFATDLYNAMGAHLKHLWLLTAIFTVCLPFFSALLVMLTQSSSLALVTPLPPSEVLKPRTLQAAEAEELPQFEAPAASDDDVPLSSLWCGCFRSSKANGARPPQRASPYASHYEPDSARSDASYATLLR